LLFDVAAVLSTSVALGPVAEAFGVHEITAYDTAIVLVVDLAATPSLPSPDAQPVPGDGFEPIGPGEFVQGSRLLQQLSLVSVPNIRDFVASNPAAIGSLLADPPRATDVTAWWDSLDAQRHAALREASPQLVGNLDGIPFQVRDIANREVLTATMSELRRVIATEDGRTVVENAKMQLRMLESIAGALGEQAPGSTRTLMSLDVAGQGKAAIVIGDLREADYVTYMVPGMFFTIEGQMGYWTDAAARLADEQRSWLALLGDDPHGTVATVAWIGYQTPNLTNVGAIDNALEGRDLLAGAITGLQALRGDDQPYITVIGHSYGSTAALMALTEYDFEVDALAVVGSPGSPAKSVDELNVRDGNVYVGEAPWDAVPDSAFFGSDPGAASYGARTFGAVGGTDPVTHEELRPSFGHIEYFSPGTESLRNLALIGIGAGMLVTGEDGSAPARVLAR
jgi:pimeloyl-ACP methyl ester carboxylesterase